MVANLKKIPCSRAFLLCVLNFKQSSTLVNAQPYLAIINLAYHLSVRKRFYNDNSSGLNNMQSFIFNKTSLYVL